MLTIATFIGKATIAFLAVTGRSGSAMPGLVVEKLYPAFLRRTIGTLPHGVVVVSGTNGKTTTTKVIAQLLEAQGLRVVTNSTGSNFVRGIISSCLRLTTWRGKLPYDIAVLELDEAHAVQLTHFVAPTGLVALNVMRDQLDRFGEIDTTARLLETVANHTTDWLVLNANDPRIATITQPDREIAWFGHAASLAPIFAPDDQHHAKNKVRHYQADDPDVLLEQYRSGHITLKINKHVFKQSINLDGSHNAINIAAAVACVRCVLADIDDQSIVDSLSGITAAFGRGEAVQLDSGQVVRLQLVKNPSGFTHSLRIAQEQHFDAIGIIINDDYADGRDVSWLWDVDFSTLSLHPNIKCGGTRGYDMALRLKYDGVPIKETVLDIESLLKSLMSGPKTQDIVIFCTYTSMIALRRVLKRYSTTLEDVGV